MNSIKCPQCGLVNWATEPVCKRCGSSLDNLSPDALFSAPAAEQATQWMAAAPAHQPFITPQMSEAAAKAWRWFVIYCVLMALLYLLLTIGAIVMLAVDTGGMGEDAEVLQIQALVLLIMGPFLFILFALPPFLKKRSWVWVYAIVLIAIGLTSCCTWPLTIPLLINWIKPEVKLMFGRS